jgi:phage-related protein
MNWKELVTAVGFCVLCVGCTDPEVRARLDTLEKRVNDLSAQSGNLSPRMKGVEEEVAELRRLETDVKLVSKYFTTIETDVRTWHAELVEMLKEQRDFLQAGRAQYLLALRSQKAAMAAVGEDVNLAIQKMQKDFGDAANKLQESIDEATKKLRENTDGASKKLQEDIGGEIKNVDKTMDASIKELEKEPRKAEEGISKPPVPPTVATPPAAAGTDAKLPATP